MNYYILTDDEFSKLLWGHCTPYFRAKIRGNRKKNPDEALVEELTEEFVAHIARITNELTEAASRRALYKEVEKCLTAVGHITEILENVPSALARLRLPYLWCISNADEKRDDCFEWPEATWSEIQYQLGILRSDRASESLISDVERLAAHVEPVMRDNPAMTLGEAMGVLAA